MMTAAQSRVADFEARQKFAFDRAVYLSGDQGAAPFSALQPVMSSLSRQWDAERVRAEAVVLDRPEVWDRWAEAERELLSRKDLMDRRRSAEDALASYILRHADPWAHRHLIEKAKSMQDCHLVGSVGLSSEGGTVVRWDHKCHDSRLCPHESHTNTKRLQGRLVDELIAWRAAKPGRRRLFYAVFSGRNVPRGELREGIDRIFDDFAELRELRAWRPLEAEIERRHGLAAPGYSDRKIWRPAVAADDTDPNGIHGGLIHLECPLSAHGDWNVHLNALLCVEGPFSYKVIRRLWALIHGSGEDCQVHFQEVKPRTQKLRDAVQELVKYSARHVAEKAEAKAEQGATKAPAMTDWPWDAFVEWYQAHQGLRRTRTWGAIYGAERDPEPELMPFVQWIGRLRFDEVAGYRVDLIPADNFHTWGPPLPMDRWTEGENHMRGPP